MKPGDDGTVQYADGAMSALRCIRCGMAVGKYDPHNFARNWVDQPYREWHYENGCLVHEGCEKREGE